MGAAAQQQIMPELVSVHSDLLGPISVSIDQVIHFDRGLLGFPECRQFVLAPAMRDGVYWLQSMEHGSLTFLVVDPFAFFDDYTVDLPDTEVDALEALHADEIAVLTIVTLPDDAAAPCTANLQGPLALHLDRGLARQIVLGDPDVPVRRPIDLGIPSRRGA